ncbi:TIM barrel protein [Paenibacillus sp. NPDC058071]|uniref:TIM barrel protein n=1 Tax=Paenibacillus sp. NPDC058071 TaxID=3346326 RepID=UPI0036D885D3
MRSNNKDLNQILSTEGEAFGGAAADTIDPELYLTVDNCFASKRWTKPDEWMTLLQDMGVGYAEASADNECDPLYMGEDYMDRWVREVTEASARTGVKIANLYSGHGTYATLGLAHHDKTVRDRMQRQWLLPLSQAAARVDAGIGFYCHAFSDSMLQDPDAYRQAEEELYDRLAAIAQQAGELGIVTPGVEQMYTPHQVPWTVDGSRKLLQEVNSRAGTPFYITLDTGHQSAQRKFRKPDAASLTEWADYYAEHGQLPSCWVGANSTKALLKAMAAAPEGEKATYLHAIEEEMTERYPYLFADEKDGDTYYWLEQLGGYSPIIHLQQTNGTASAHQPFTEASNRNGIIFGEPVLKALETAYRNSAEPGMPPKCGKLYLTLEIFSGTSELYDDILRKMEESVRYWRTFIPRDGIKLSEALQLLRG